LATIRMTPAQLAELQRRFGKDWYKVVMEQAVRNAANELRYPHTAMALQPGDIVRFEESGEPMRITALDHLNDVVHARGVRSGRAESDQTRYVEWAGATIDGTCRRVA
jgi:hypothetical protein